MKYTLLEMVQLILSAMDSDEVNAISDTTESLQVANMARSVFYDMCVDLNLPAYETIFQLEPSIDPDKPVLMTAPSTSTLLRHVDWIKYDNVDPTLGETTANYVDITYVTPEDFITRQTGYRLNTQNVAEMEVTVNGQVFKFMHQTDLFPLYFTTFDDKTYIFDSYRADIDTTLQKSKTFCKGMQYEVFLLENNYTPNLEPDQFSYLINKLKLRAFNELKQMENKEAAAETRRQKIVQQKRKRQTTNLPEVFKVARYGRNSSFGTLDSILEKNGRNSV